MKIAVIGAKGLPPRQGGIEHYCAEVCPRIVEEEHSVSLFAQSSYTGATWTDRYTYRGVDIQVLPSLGINGCDTFLSSAFGAVASILQDYDIVHFHALGPSLFVPLTRFSSRAKIVVTCHGLDWQRAKWGKFSSSLIRIGERMAVKYAHELIVVSTELQDYFQQNYQRKTVHIPNAPAGYVDSNPRLPYLKTWGLQPHQYMVFLGRLVPEKCPDLLIQAFQSLYPANWKLVLVGGNGSSDAFTQGLYRLAANNPNIVFTGELRGEPLAEVIRGAGLFVLPSNLEGSPLALLEAMREGIPCIASDIMPHQELLLPDRGILFPTGRLEGLIDALKLALASPSILQEQAQKAQNYIQLHHSWSHVSTHILQIYERLGQNHGAHRSQNKNGGRSWSLSSTATHRQSVAPAVITEQSSPLHNGKIPPQRAGAVAPAQLQKERIL
jgi:glycosyltransferase involved in cell wall biosynthesis